MKRQTNEMTGWAWDRDNALMCEATWMIQVKLLLSDCQNIVFTDGFHVSKQSIAQGKLKHA